MPNIPSRDWRKRSNRFQKGRDNLKNKNREKAVKIKALESKARDLQHSRDQWKKKIEVFITENNALKNELEEKNKILEAEKKLHLQEKEMMANEIEFLKKKSRNCSTSSSPRK